MNPKVLQVDSDSHHELQGIAATLSLAKKVVVVIGAVVSTAANIPVCWRCSGVIFLSNKHRIFGLEQDSMGRVKSSPMMLSGTLSRKPSSYQ